MDTLVYGLLTKEIKETIGASYVSSISSSDTNNVYLDVTYKKQNASTDTVRLTFPKPLNGVNGVSIVSASFVGDDMVFTRSDSSTLVIVGAKTLLTPNIESKQDLLVSGTNIKTVLGQTIVGSGNLDINADQINTTSTTNKFITQSRITKLDGIEAGAQVNTVNKVNEKTGDVVLTQNDIDDTASYIRMTPAEKSKLAGIEPNATGDQSASEVLALIKTVDGTGSGLDADLLGGQSLATLQASIGAKQDALVSGNNIKTINGNSILGSGDLTISGGGGGGGAVDSVNGQVGVVVLDADDISDTTTANKFVTVAEKTNIANSATHIANTSNPHNTTKAQIGLENVDNTSDLNKPISLLQQEALNSKANSDSVYNKIESDNRYESKNINIQNHISNILNPHNVTKEQIGLNNVNNTSDLNKPVSTATQMALDTKQDNLVSGTNIKTINGQSVLGIGDIVISGEEVDLTNYYDKTQTETLLSNKVEKEAGKGLSTNDFTNTFKQAYDGHLTSTSNPHNVTALQVGAYSKSENDNLLIKKANLDLNNKIPLSEIPDSILGQLKYMGVWDFSSGFPTGAQKGNYWITSVSGNGYEVGDWAVYNGTSFDKVDNTDAVSSVAGRTGNVVLNKTDVGLNNVDNTTDLLKPISTATQSALNLKAPLASPTFTGTVSGITKTMVGLNNVDNTSDLNKPISTATQSALDLKVDKDKLPSSLNPIIISGQVGSQTNVSVGKIPFGEIWVNIGGISYNPTTRRFTVPQSGTYRITMNPFKNQVSATARVLVGINTDAPTPSTHRGHTYANGGGVYSTMSINSVVNLSANDYIVFYLFEGELWNSTSDRFNQFTIERIANI